MADNVYSELPLSKKRETETQTITLPASGGSYTIHFCPSLRCQMPTSEMIEPYRVRVTWPKHSRWDKARVWVHRKLWVRGGVYRKLWDPRTRMAMFESSR